MTIVSSDKDLMQLVDEDAGGCIDMLDTMKNQRIDIPEVVEKFGVGPELVGDVLALMGDCVDNVPGIYGIGPKTASKLIQRVSATSRRVLAQRPTRSPSPSSSRSLIDHADDARLSRELVRLRVRRCRCPSRSTELALNGIPKEPLRGIPRADQGFKTLLQRMVGGWRAERARRCAMTSWRQWSRRSPPARSRRRSR